MNSRTLIIQLARFGDVLQTKRLVKSLQAHSTVHMAVDSSLARLASLVYPSAVVHPLQAHCSASSKPEDVLKHNFCSLGEISENDYDLVVNLNFSGLNFSLARLFDPSSVRGYINRSGQEARHSWTRLFFRLAAHRKLSALNLMDFWGLYSPHPVSPHEVNPPASGKGRGIGVVLAGRNARRSVPMDILTRITQSFVNRADCSRIVLLGTEAEKSLAREFKCLASPVLADDIEDLTGRTSLTDLPEVLSSLEMIITPDTGTMHLAAHLGVRVVALFVSSAFCFETGPYGQGHRIFQAMPRCGPCVENRECNFDLVCHDILKSKETFRVIWKGEGPMRESALFESYTDDLGVDYLPLQGLDEQSDRRKALRELLRRYLGYPYADIKISQEDDRIFYHESQWMLERQGLDQG